MSTRDETEIRFDAVCEACRRGFFFIVAHSLGVKRFARFCSRTCEGRSDV
jgi:hypothetical protein